MSRHAPVLDDNSEKLVIEDAAQPAVLAHGDLLFVRGETLLVVTSTPTHSPREASHV